MTGTMIFNKGPFASCHASTVCELEPGRFLAAWFGGTAEGAKDVQIWGSRFDGRTWTAPEILGGHPNQPAWNPVLFLTAAKTLILWYKIGPSPTNWIGVARRSQDLGKTWSKPVMLPAGQYGPVRAKPIQRKDGTILAGTSVEAGERALKVWTPYVDRSTDDGISWLRSNPYPVPTQPLGGQIQPTLFETATGTIVALTRSHSPFKICRAESTDGGVTFGPSEPTGLDNPNSGIDVVKTAQNDLFLIYNPLPIGRTPLCLARSTDDGKSWYRVKDLEAEPGEYSYPAILQAADGTLAMTYTWRRTHIKFVTVDPAKLRT